MRIQKIHLHHVRLPLKFVFEQKDQKIRISDSMILKIQTTEGAIGYGEACLSTNASGEAAQGVANTIASLQEELLNKNFRRLEDIKGWSLNHLDQGTGSAAICAIELALIDAWCWEYQKDLIETLGVYDRETPILKKSNSKKNITTAEDSLVTFTDVKRLIETSHCHHLNLNISKHGGFFNTLRIYEYAQKHNIPCQLGAYCRGTSLLNVIGLAFALLAKNLTTWEVTEGAFRFKEDLTNSPLKLKEDGQLENIDLPMMGWPVVINELQLNRYSVRTEFWEKKKLRRNA